MQEAGALCMYLRHGYCECSYRHEKFGGFGRRYVTIDYKTIPWYHIVSNRGRSIMKTPQPMRHARARAQRKSEKPSRIECFIEEAQSPERSSRREKVARALGMLATIGATLTAATGISLYHDSGNMEPVVNLLNPAAEHVMTTDEKIAATKGFPNIVALEGHQMEETAMHWVARGTYATGISAITLQLLNEQAERTRDKAQRKKDQL